MSFVIDEGSKGPLAAATRRIRDSFLQTIEAFGSYSSPITGISPEIALTDSLERFQLWVGSVGAAIDGQKKISLEWRLKEAPDIKEEILSLSNDLTEALEDLYAIATGERQNRVKDADTTNIGEYSDSAEVRIDLRAVNEVQDIIDVIVACVRSLLRLSILIRKASPRDRWNRALQQPESGRLDDSFDIRHVGEKFPKLARPENEWLKNRLGRAITQRRQFIRYCRQHKDQLSGQSTYDQASIAPNAAPLPHVKENIQDPTPANGELALGASTKASTLQKTTLEAIRDDVDDDAISAVSSVVSFHDPTDEHDNQLRLPTLQAVSNGREEFNCPLCFTVQSFQHQRKWEKHAYADLKPYVCSSGKNECDLEIFPDHKTWFVHELEHHRHHWVCTLCHRDPFDSLARFRAHVQNKHKEISSNHISGYVSLCKRPLPLLPAGDCPFCDDFDFKLREIEAKRGTESNQNAGLILVPASTFRRHLASHMKQLALFAMGPSIGGEPSDSDSRASQERGSARDADIMKNYLESQNKFERESTFSFVRTNASKDVLLSHLILRQVQEPHHLSGQIYVFRYDGSGLLRVGASRDAVRRVKELEKRCQVQITVILIQKNIPNVFRAEELVLKEIGSMQKRVKCQCGLTHYQLFDAPSQQVVKSVTRWVDFVQQDPYDSNGFLEEMWRNRLLELNPEHEHEWDHFVSLS